MKPGTVEQNKDEAEHLSIQRRLEALGVGDLESRAYISLLKGGPSTARNLALSTRIGRTDAYRVAKSLANRGLVKITFTNPNKYEALPPKVALEILVSGLEDSVRSVKKEIPELIMSLESIRQVETASLNQAASNRITLLSGKSVISSWREDLSNAKKEVLRLWSPDGIRMNYKHGLFEDFVECAKRNITIRAITEILRTNLYECEEFSSIVELRHLENVSDALRYQLTDGQHIIISSMDHQKDERQMEAVTTNNPVLIKGFERNFESLWTKAIPAKARIKELGLQTIGRSRT